MKKKVYNKLVRDMIPEIITKNGEHPITEILDNNEYKKKLDEKLLEEVNEYQKDDNVEELADIMEVILSILKFKNIDVLEFENIVKNKRNKKGGFENKIFLKEVIEL
ncbi:MAG: nucleoside triphosphate pyrophosphohydrolase [Clostridia bacterium]|nr:nucleoside triphosphate pyrophosphohydrolase [Clostridia bacterium]MDD4386442.1 nucleoside triphosphate pyrophosphohydrolase [Clostridia bacterium]